MVGYQQHILHQLMSLQGHLWYSCLDAGKDVFFNFNHPPKSLILACQTPVVYEFRDQTETVISNLILRCLCTVPVCKSLLKCVAHSRSQELHDELSAWSQISAWLPLVCIKSQQGGKMATPPKQKFCANPHPLILLNHPTPVCPHSPVFLTSEHHDSLCSTAQIAQFTPLPQHFNVLWIKANCNNSLYCVADG